MIAFAQNWIRRQQFNPGILGAFINPFFLARRQLWREIKAANAFCEGPLLDVGCGSKPYRSLFKGTYIGLDVYSDATRRGGTADVFYGGKNFPFQDGSFNSVICNQVLEHVFNPGGFLAEIRRVLVPGGKLLLTVPFVWDEHEQPYDYARYSSFGLRALLEQHGFRVITHRKLLADVSTLFQLGNAYIYKVTRTRSRYANSICTLLVMGPISLMGLVLGKLLPQNEDLFLDQLVIAESIR